jgi:CheY-like chemotaxis protein
MTEQDIARAAAGHKGRVLVVDDDEAILKAYERVLKRDGFLVDTALNGQAAVAMIPVGYDAIVSDIAMPGMDGLEFLRTVRQHDLDVPVVMATGGPSVETAARAVELGAFRYLVKPIDINSFRDIVTQAVRVHRLARLKREAQSHLGGTSGAIGDLAGLEVRFISALKSLWMAYQPIVSLPDRRIMGYEALVRTKEPAIPHPGALFDAAERLGWVHELGRVIRDHIAKAASSFPDAGLMFANLHPDDCPPAPARLSYRGGRPGGRLRGPQQLCPNGAGRGQARHGAHTRR